MRTVIIVAMNQNRLIGKAGGLPWHVPADLRHFKQTTMGHALIMGRNTFNSCGKPLPGRRNIVITRDPAAQRAAASGTSAAPPLGVAHAANTSLDFVASLETAIELCRSRGEQIAFIVGGSQIYAQAMPLVDEMIITMIDAPNAEGDAYFPEIDQIDWETSPFTADPSLRVTHYRRKATFER